jgi:acid phosphatase type 7
MKPQPLLALMFCLVANSCGGGDQTTLETGFELLAAGDVAQCNGLSANPLASNAQLTALFAERAEYQHLPILALGDLAYYTGSPAEFAQCYEPTWGRLKSRTLPVPGNHEYGTPNAQGYKDYFGQQAMPAGKTFYSLNLGNWHIVALDSNLDMAAQSEQVQWLRADLEKHKAIGCTLAYWHHPRFSSASVHPSNPLSQPVWALLNEYGADVVLTGHNHQYERFEPLDALGKPSSAGIASFVVGTGGASLYGFTTPVAGSQFRNNTDFGFLKLSLSANAYRWAFIPINGASALDSGTANCH